MNSYQYITANNNPLFAISADAPRWLFKEGIKTLLPLSLKRRIVKFVLNVVHCVKLEQYLWRPIIDLTNFSGRCDAIVNALNPESNRYILIRFRVPMEANVCYAYVYDDQQRLIEFVKIGLDVVMQASLQCEADNMQLAQQAGFAAFQIPELIAYQKYDNFSVLRTQAISNIEHLQPLSAQRIIDQYSQSIWEEGLFEKSLEQSSWWQDFVERRELTPSLYKFLSANKSKHYKACTTHGDLRRQNIITTVDQKLYLVDWEHFTPDGPFLSDVIAFMTQYHKDLSATNIANYLKLHYHISRPSDWDIACALAFLSSRNRFKKANHYGTILANGVQWGLVGSVSSGVSSGVKS